ncbi:homing endonuclease associated repeat-containing protein [Hydrogenophaga sp.]|uniref:homing endonuclease associated repeat-containing protein n=1 Tax=Hydrogenophaga sp. TaxID=1904254 RepID=UPI002735298C|nr:HNH endonuclease [Hydrogenophaga sp.]MDP3887415.1 HNH endonuclease [Hydrogenophaga sp.]
MKFELTTLDEYSDESLLAELRRVADSLQGQRLTRERFDSLGRVHSSTLHNRFGSWAAALDKAGISESVAPRFRVLNREAVLETLREFAAANPGKSATEKEIAERLGMHRGAITRRFGKWETILAEVGLDPVPLGRRYTDEECFENILTLWTHYGRQPNFGELKCPPSVVGPKAYIRRWGGWRAALTAFVKSINESPELQAQPVQSAPSPVFQKDTPQYAEPVPRSISLALRYRVLVRDKFRCVICGASPAKDGTVELHVDHIFPWSRGGQNTEENLRTLCFKCNLGKGDKVENAQPGSQEGLR